MSPPVNAPSGASPRPEDRTAPFERLCAHARLTALWTSIEELLAWDERTKLPPAAGAYRAEQMTQLAGLIHQRRTDPRLGELLAELAQADDHGDPHGERRATIRQLRRRYEKFLKLPQSLVEAYTRATVLGQQAWVEARPKNDFAGFRPHLEGIVRLAREKADALGLGDCRYDSLLDDYEPEARTADVAQVLAGLRADLTPLVAAIVDSRRRPDPAILRRRFPRHAQETFARAVVERLGFEFRRGRLDETAHPFCTTVGPDDCRITTRYDENYFPTAFFGTLHEAGHGMYEQGLRGEWFGLPPGEAASLGIHESQSRLWENLVGRSRPFWRHFYPQAQRAFPDALAHVPLDAFHFAVNDVRPSLIRVEADEATYNLHILVRFELEQLLFNDNLPVAELPAAWNEKYKSYLGIVAPTDSDGVLQDIHWSAGLIGYFPTYALGNLYAAQLFDRAAADLGDLEVMFSEGEFGPLLGWLRAKVHAAGHCWSAAELVERVTGEPLSHRPLIAHLRRTLGPLYGP
jgi:carboxypeptidase Taq